MNVLSKIKQEITYRLFAQQNIKSKELAKSYSFNGGFKRIYYYHIRKCGGTSLNQMFLSLGGDPREKVYKELPRKLNYRIISGDKVFVGWNQKLIEEGNYYYAFSHMPQHQFKLPPDTFTITGLRDPEKRVLSLYRMLLEMKKNNVKHPSMPEQGEWLGRNFSDFLDRVPKERLLRQLYMFSKTLNVEEAFARITGCSYFYFLSDFPKEVERLSAKLSIELNAIHVRKTSLKVELNQNELEKLRFTLKPSISLIEKLKEYKLKQQEITASS